MANPFVRDPLAPEALAPGALPESLDQDTYERAYDALTRARTANATRYLSFIAATLWPSTGATRRTAPWPLVHGQKPTPWGRRPCGP